MEQENQSEVLKQQQEFFQNILDCIHDRIYVSDPKGKILMVNKAVEQDYDNEITKEYLIGKNLKDLVREGLMEESLTLKVLETNKAQGWIYQEPEGYELMAWGNPHIEDGKIQFVVCTEWDTKSLDTLQAFLNEDRGLPANIKSELVYYRTKTASQTEIIAKSPAMQNLLRTASISARSDATSLICGESGTGKEVLMKYMHFKSARSDAPLIEVNCGAIPDTLVESEFFGYVKGAFTGADEKGKPGLFELANHGTLFLDEVEALPLPAQAKFLRVLQEKEVCRIGGHINLPIDVKIIAATNVDLRKMVERKEFRADLFYRLNVISFDIPPLRERKEDIPELVRHFTKHYNIKYKTNKIISPKDLDLFIRYPWPGNVRELQNIIERTLLTTKEERIPRRVLERQLALEEQEPETVSELDAPDPPPGGMNLKEAVEEFERKLLLSYMPFYENSRQFAEFLGVEKSTVNRKLKKYGIRT
ncbi:MAG: sigma 54-interacting transcriptional regulator [Firmicutes bacterium]|jgi:TyrR family helix-turn-helix protein|nr:sigma 54-interacting transcriptional regulator [Bacillota bacterium]NBI62906.1 transcriptional regulator [Clostridiales bacterium]